MPDIGPPEVPPPSAPSAPDVMPSYYAGYTPPQGAIGSGGSGGVNFGMQPWSPGFQATAGAYGQSQQAFHQAQQALAKQYAGSPFGQQVLGQFGSLGMDPRMLEQQRRMAAETFAGSRENALRQMQQRGAATGFGNSMGMIDAEGRMRAQSTADLSDAQNQLFFQQQQMNQQGSMAAMQGYLQLLGLDASQSAQLANLLAHRQFPAIPGVTPGPGQQQGGVQPPGSGSGWWNQQGQYQQGPMGHDPFYNPQNPYQGAGHTPQNPWSPW